MLSEFKIYKCNICGNVVEVVNEGAPNLTCCEQAMEKLEAKTQDEGQEKHVPVPEKVSAGFLIKVGGVSHPMEEKHYIKFIEVATKEKVHRKELHPGDKPEALFDGVKESEIVLIREYCTVHNLWKA